MGIALENLGRVRAKLGHPKPALRLLRAALVATRSTNNRRSEALALNELGVVHRSLGDLSRAVAYHREALAVTGDAGYRHTECAVHNEFGRTLLAAGDRAGALEQHQRALDGASKIKHKYAQAQALDGIAACLRDTDPDAARRHWLRALRLYQELDVPERHDVEQALAELAA